MTTIAKQAIPMMTPAQAGNPEDETNVVGGVPGVLLNSAGILSTLTPTSVYYTGVTLVYRFLCLIHSR